MQLKEGQKRQQIGENIYNAYDKASLIQKLFS